MAHSITENMNMVKVNILLAVLVIAASAAAGEAALPGAGEPVGRKFELRKIDGRAVELPRPVFLEWKSPTEISGRICNVFRGKCLFQNSLVTITDVAASRMLCPDEDLGGLERDLLAHLRGGMSFLLTGDVLELRRDAAIFEFVEADSEDDASHDAPRSAPAPAPASAVGKGDLIGRTFNLTHVNGDAFEEEMGGRRPFVEFLEDFRVAGRACNSFSGPGELTDGVLRVANAASTMMMCVNSKLVQLERDLYALLREGAAVELREGVLTLSGSEIVLTYEEVAAGKEDGK